MRPPCLDPAGTRAQSRGHRGRADRTEADRKLDAGRKPVNYLRFLRLESGMKVAELFAGGGYTTELLARAVGPTGVVYGQNSQWVLEKFADKPWSERLARPMNRNVVRVDRELGDPFPPRSPTWTWWSAT